MSFIWINGKYWYFDNIKALRTENFADYPKLEEETLTIARNWLDGQPNFSLKTSGSSGSPKTLTFSREQIGQSVEQTTKAFDLKPGDQLLNPLSPGYVAGFMMLMRGLILETPVFLVEPSRKPFPEDLLNQKFALSAFVPLQIKKLLENGYQPQLNDMKAIIIGGGPMNQQLENEVSQLSAATYHTYGMTETLTHVAIRQIAPTQERGYKALPGNEFEQGSNEELIIHTPLSANPITTNDRVQLKDRYHFSWLGRLDRVVNSGAYKIQLEPTEAEIAKALKEEWGTIPEFFLTAIPDKELGQKLLLILKTEKPLSPNAKQALNKVFRNYLPAYEIPKATFDLREFAYTHTGKVDQYATLNSITFE